MKKSDIEEYRVKTRGFSIQAEFYFLPATCRKLRKEHLPDLDKINREFS